MRWSQPARCALGIAALSGCWTGGGMRSVHFPVRQSRLPRIQILSDSSPQRLALCRAFRESEQFEEVRCSDAPESDVPITLRMRVETTEWSSRIAEQVAFGAASLGTCMFWGGGRARQQHVGELSFGGVQTRIAGQGDGATQRVTCLLPGIYFVTIFSVLWAPAAGASPDTWPALEQTCGDPFTTGDRTTAAAQGAGLREVDRRACNVIRQIVMESAGDAATALINATAAAVVRGQRDHRAVPAAMSGPADAMAPEQIQSAPTPAPRRSRRQ